MDKGIVIFIFFILALSISLSGCIESDSMLSLSLDKIPPIILIDKKDDHLRVLSGNHKLNWSDVKIKSGNCTLPTGYIEAGDKITDCSGLIVLIWVPSNSIIGEWDFS